MRWARVLVEPVRTEKAKTPAGRPGAPGTATALAVRGSAYARSISSGDFTFARTRCVGINLRLVGLISAASMVDGGCSYGACHAVFRPFLL